MNFEPKSAFMTTPCARTAIVTGASRGIGRAIALALGAQRFNVVINYHSSAAAAQEVAQAIVQAGGAAETVQADVGHLADHEKIVAAARDRFGAVHLLVNNAGVAPKVRADLLELSEAGFDQVLDTNLKGTFFLTQRVARFMIEQAPPPESRRPPESAQGGVALSGGDGRAIINIASISAYTASLNRGEYCMAKAGIGMMTQLFAARLAAHGINVYEIRPGIIATDMTSGQAVKAKYDKLILEGDLLPIRRWGRPEDVAQAVVAVAQGLLPYSTGQVLDVDGGFHIRRL